MKEISTYDIYQFLKANNLKASFIDKLKIVYRPFICPFDELLSNIELNSSVFDIGCGSGQFLSIIARFKEPKALGGVEIDEKLVVNAHHLLKDFSDIVKIGKYDGFNLPEYIRDFDYISLIDVIHHIGSSKQQQKDFISETYNKMKPGSKLIFKDIDAGSILVWGNKLHDLILSGEIGSELRASEAKDMLIAQGFKTSDISFKRLYWYSHYTIICTKA